MDIVLEHAHLVIDGQREYLDGALVIKGDSIEEVYPHSNKINRSYEGYAHLDLRGALVMPGFFDTHTHGIIGHDFDQCDLSAFEEASFAYALDGTTSFHVSLSPTENTGRQLEVLKEFAGNGSTFEGIHLEGPFVNKEVKGALNVDCLKEPDVSLLKEYLEINDHISSMTLASELKGSEEVISCLRENDIRVMLGHSAAIGEEIARDYDGITHLYNCMKPFHHRNHSLVNEGLLNHPYVELIADGNHINEDVLKMTMETVDRDRLILISDSTLAKGLPDGEYEFCGQKCTKEGINFHNDHALAGSVISVNDGMKTMKKLGAKNTDLLLMSSLNAFRLYGKDRRNGTLEKGKYADLAVMKDDLDVLFTFVKGRPIYA